MRRWNGPSGADPGAGACRAAIHLERRSRPGIPSGARKDKNIKIPQWILKNKECLLKYLRGLYEAEGSFCIHRPTCTYKFLFSNKNESLLNNVYRALIILGFHPNKSGYKVQISRREEVFRIKNLIKFRQY